MHTKVDGYSVGEHPLVSRSLKGAFNQHPPELENMGENSKLSLQELTLKLVILLCLIRPSRSSDLDLNFSQYIPEGFVTFQAFAWQNNREATSPDQNFSFQDFQDRLISAQ